MTVALIVMAIAGLMAIFVVGAGRASASLGPVLERMPETETESRGRLVGFERPKPLPFLKAVIKMNGPLSKRDLLDLVRAEGKSWTMAELKRRLRVAMTSGRTPKIRRAERKLAISI